MKKLFERFKSMYCISILLSIVASILNVTGSYRLGSLLTEETIHSTHILLRNICILLGVFILFYISNSANLQSCGCRLAIFVNEQNNKI